MEPRKLAANAVVWALLISMPFWLVAVGGYTSLGTQVVVLALAATALNFLLGFTGVLSFGHAAFFGLGSYGAGLTIKYLLPDTLAGVGVGVAVGTLAAAVIGALIVRLRGIYFAMVTIAFGQVFYFIAYRWNTVTGGDDGLSGWHRFPVDLGFAKIDILNSQIAFYYFVLFWFAVSTAIMAMLLHSPFGRTLLAIRENETRALSRHSRRFSHLAVVADFLRLRKLGRHTLCAPQRLRRSAFSALGAVRRIRNHGSPRRHALVLGAADRCRHFHRAAELYFQPHRKLDDVYRHIFHAGRAVLPARGVGRSAWQNLVASGQAQGSAARRRVMSVGAGCPFCSAP